MGFMTPFSPVLSPYVRGAFLCVGIALFISSPSVAQAQWQPVPTPNANGGWIRSPYSPNNRYQAQPRYQAPNYQQPRTVSPGRSFPSQVGSPGFQQTYSSAGSAYTGNTPGSPYNRLQREGSELFKQGRMSEALDRFKQALGMAPDRSKAAAYNNLAATYLKRGQYYARQLNDYDKALADYRMAAYTMHTAWPEGLPKKPLHQENELIGLKNLRLGYQQLGLPTNSGRQHYQWATKLRAQRQFEAALLEYQLALESKQHALDPREEQNALLAMADLFNVKNRSDKAAIYYQRVVAAQQAAPSEELSLKLANMLLKNEDLEKAATVLGDASEQNPNNPALLAKLEEVWRAALKREPDNPVAHANLAGIFQKQKRYDLALKAYQKAETLLTQTPGASMELKKSVRLNLGTLYQQTGNLAMAEKAYESVKQIDTSNKQATDYLATLYDKSNQAGKSIGLKYEQLERNPGNLALHEDILTQIQKLSSPQAIEKELETYASRFADRAESQARVGELFHDAKRYPAAITYYRKALTLNRKDANVWANLGAAYQAQGEHKRAYEAFKTAKQLKPKDTSIAALYKQGSQQLQYQNLKKAKELSDKGDWLAAATVYEKALDQRPKELSAWLSLGILYQEHQQLEKAASAYRRGLKVFPKNADLAYALGTTYHQQNRYDKARSAYQQALKLKPSYSDAKEQLVALDAAQGSIALQKGAEAYAANKYDTALKQIATSLQYLPKEPTAYYYQGLAYSAKKNPKSAIVSFQKAVKYDPSLADAHYSLAVELDQVNRTSEAKNAYQAFVRTGKGADPALLDYAKSRLAELGG